MTAPLRPGQIVWVTLPDPQGRNPKTRPAAVCSVSATGVVGVVAITSQIGRAPPEVTVPVPWQRNGHPRTKLRRPSEAICSWAATVPAASVQATTGRVPLTEMNLIAEILKRLYPGGTP